MKFGLKIILIIVKINIQLIFKADVTYIRKFWNIYLIEHNLILQ